MRLKHGDSNHTIVTMITDYDIQAFVDNELDQDASDRVLRYLDSDASAKRRYQELMLQKQLINSWWQRIDTKN